VLFHWHRWIAVRLPYCESDTGPVFARRCAGCAAIEVRRHPLDRWVAADACDAGHAAILDAAGLEAAPASPSARPDILHRAAVTG
jgi:hypothetical protein